MNINQEKEYWSRAVGEVLEAAGLTIEELAEKMGVDPRTVYAWKAGHRPSGILAVRFFEFRKTCLLRIVMHGQGSVV